MEVAKSMSRGTIHRTIRIADDIWLPAKARADAEGVNLSEVIRAALRAYGESGAAEQFLAGYMKRSGLSRQKLLERRVVATCVCGDESCEGYQVIPEDCLAPWRGETVLIRA